MSPADDQSAPTTLPSFKPLPQKAPDVTVERRPDGSVLIRSNHAPGNGPVSIAHLLAERAAEHPDRPYILQREPNHGPWRGVTYGEAKRAADGVAQWLLDKGLTNQESVMVLSANSVDHALVMLGCYTAGVPIAPISPAYSLISTDHAKLKHCFATVRPKVVFAQSGAMFERAFETLRGQNPDLLFVTVDGVGGTPLSELIATAPTPAVEAARAGLNHKTVANTCSPPALRACRRGCRRPTACSQASSPVRKACAWRPRNWPNRPSPWNGCPGAISRRAISASTA